MFPRAPARPTGRSPASQRMKYAGQSRTPDQRCHAIITNSTTRANRVSQPRAARASRKSTATRDTTGVTARRPRRPKRCREQDHGRHTKHAQTIDNEVRGSAIGALEVLAGLAQMGTRSGMTGSVVGSRAFVGSECTDTRATASRPLDPDRSTRLRAKCWVPPWLSLRFSQDRSTPGPLAQLVELRTFNP